VDVRRDDARGAQRFAAEPSGASTEIAKDAERSIATSLRPLPIAVATGAKTQGLGGGKLEDDRLAV
jgi:hypothetical protein